MVGAFAPPGGGGGRGRAGVRRILAVVWIVVVALAFRFAYVSGAVRLGAARGDAAVVLAGVEPGERVVVDGPANLKAGMRVVVKTQ